MIDFARILSRAQSGSGLAGPVVLETRAAGTLRIRGHFHRREVYRRIDDVEIEDAEPMLTVPTHDAPLVDKGDLVLVKGSLWHVLKPLELGDGSTRLSLQKPQWTDVIMSAGGMRKAAFVGNERGMEATALVPAGAPWAVGEEFEGGRLWAVAAVEAWETGWSRLTLAAA